MSAAARPTLHVHQNMDSEHIIPVLLSMFLPRSSAPPLEINLRSNKKETKVFAEQEAQTEINASRNLRYWKSLNALSWGTVTGQESGNLNTAKRVTAKKNIYFDRTEIFMESSPHKKTLSTYLNEAR